MSYGVYYILYLLINSISFQGESPSSGKFTALGFYLLASLFFVVSNFVEFAIVLYLCQCNEKKCNRKLQSFKKKPNINNGTANENEISCIYGSKPTYDVRSIDRVSFAVASLLFLLFNIFYWITFLIFLAT